MKLASIISVWADCIELLPFCIANHLRFCDGVIVVWSQHSNHWEKNDGVLEYILANGHDSRVEFHQLEPMRGGKLLFNETRKRNYGIAIAQQKDFTHVLIADADEFWDPEIIKYLKTKIESNKEINGFVHPLRVFIKLPTLWTYDHTLVPGIQKLTPKFEVGEFKSYPFAYDIHNKAHIDPSRRPNTLMPIVFIHDPMYHMSYVRKNIDLKIDNSSANLKKSRQVIYDELRNARSGYISKLYHQELNECENFFNIVI